MSRLMSMMRWDVSLQARHHIFTANIVSTAAICGFVFILPVEIMSASLASFFVFADPALIGLSFIGAIVLMEKATRVHLALGVTPSPPWVYVMSKTVILTLAGTLSGLAVAWTAYRGDFDWPLMIWALLLSNALAVLIGLVLVARCQTMNQLLMQLLYATTILFIPLLAHFNVVPDAVKWGLAIIPSSAMLWLLNAAGDLPSVPPWQVWGGTLYLLFWIGLMWMRALRDYSAAILSDGR